MADLIEYIRWRGDLTFLERPFNEVDNLVLSQIAYHAFDGIVPGETTAEADVGVNSCASNVSVPATGPASRYIRLQDAADIFFTDPGRGAIPGQDQTRNNEFLREAADSARFRDVLLSDYVNRVSDSEELQTQFCALVFTLPDGSCYTAFRGTDDTIVGWREDFMISYMVTYAQLQSVEYLERHLREDPIPGRKWRVGGHSKGGNLAMYSAAHLPDDLLPKLTGVYSNDGPGLDPELADSEKIKRLNGIYHKIVPAYDIIGMLLEDREACQKADWLTIVKSSEKGIMQHWALSWQVERDHFQRAKELDRAADSSNQMLDRWVSSASFEEREAFVGTLFDAMGVFGPNMSDFLNAGLKSSGALAESYFHGSAENKAAVSKFFKSLSVQNKINAEEKAQEREEKLRETKERWDAAVAAATRRLHERSDSLGTAVSRATESIEEKSTSLGTAVARVTESLEEKSTPLGAAVARAAERLEELKTQPKDE